MHFKEQIVMQFERAGFSTGKNKYIKNQQLKQHSMTLNQCNVVDPISKKYKLQAKNDWAVKTCEETYLRHGNLFSTIHDNNR